MKIMYMKKKYVYSLQLRYLEFNVAQSNTTLIVVQQWPTKDFDNRKRW